MKLLLLALIGGALHGAPAHLSQPQPQRDQPQQLQYICYQVGPARASGTVHQCGWYVPNNPATPTQQNHPLSAH